MKTIAITGATGFVGSHVLTRLTAKGYSARALTRKPIINTNKDVAWIKGELANPESLIDLCTGADTLVHIAGTIKAQSKADFTAGNITGTGNVIAAAKQAGIKRIIFISSITAREPMLSYYAETKAGAEQVVKASETDWTILRLAAVYGPGDHETLSFFKAAKGMAMPLSNPQAKLSLIHIDDCAAAIIAACADTLIGQTIELGDGTVLTQGSLARAIAEAVGGTPFTFRLPRFIAWCAGGISELLSHVTGASPMLTRKKVAELYHDDWSTPNMQLTEQTGWRPGIDLASGLKQTCQWYRAQGWLSPE